MTTRAEVAANAISESSGMRFDGFWSRIEDLEPEDREYALREASAALAAADAHDAANGVHRLVIDDATVERAARALDPDAWNEQAWVFVVHGQTPSEARANLQASAKSKARRVLAAAVKEDGE